MHLDDLTDMNKGGLVIRHMQDDADRAGAVNGQQGSAAISGVAAVIDQRPRVDRAR
jgi:hypothetical protein